MTVLPFDTEADLQDLGDKAVAFRVPCSIWPANPPRSGPAGNIYDHQGEAELSFATELQVPNRQLVINDRTYKIVSATPNEYLPHVALQLREVKPGG